MLLRCTLGEHPLFVAQFPDGTQLPLPRVVHDTLELMSRLTGIGERRLKDIGTAEELRQAVASFCRELAAASAQATDALAWSVLGSPATQRE
jgi:hypothetical protein